MDIGFFPPLLILLIVVGSGKATPPQVVIDPGPEPQVALALTPKERAELERLLSRVQRYCIEDTDSTGA
jgi:hypothetical protein